MQKLLIIDDEYFVRLGIRETIDWAAYGFEVAGDADNGLTGLEMARELQPDVIITDVRMPTMDGLEFMARCREEGVNAPIIVLSAHEEFRYAKAALQQGASDYLLKPILNEQLIEAVVKAGEAARQQRDKDSYLQQVTEGLSQVREQALTDILTNDQLTQDAIRQKRELFRLDLAETGNYVVFIRLQDYHVALQKLTPLELRTQEARMLALARRWLETGRAAGTYLVRREDKDLVAVIHMESEREEAAASLKTDCLRFIRELAEQAPGLTAAVGISLRCDKPDALAAAYRQAYMASYKNLLPSQNSVAYAGDGEAAGYRREITAALDYIREHYASELTVETIAAALYISASHLMHLFRDELGKTVNECVTEYRIQAAKDMLKSGKYKMLDVSQRVGYKNEKYFTRVFRKVTGQSPSEYARRNR